MNEIFILSFHFSQGISGFSLYHICLFSRLDLTISFITLMVESYYGFTVISKAHPFEYPKALFGVIFEIDNSEQEGNILTKDEKYYYCIQVMILFKQFKIKTPIRCKTE